MVARETMFKDLLHSITAGVGVYISAHNMHSVHTVKYTFSTDGVGYLYYFLQTSC